MRKQSLRRPRTEENAMGLFGDIIFSVHGYMRASEQARASFSSFVRAGSWLVGNMITTQGAFHHWIQISPTLTKLLYTPKVFQLKITRHSLVLVRKLLS
jgi:hypothetical protein